MSNKPPVLVALLATLLLFFGLAGASFVVDVATSVGVPRPLAWAGAAAAFIGLGGWILGLVVTRHFRE